VLFPAWLFRNALIRASRSNGGTSAVPDTSGSTCEATGPSRGQIEALACRKEPEVTRDARLAKRFGQICHGFAHRFPHFRHRRGRKSRLFERRELLDERRLREAPTTEGAQLCTAIQAYACSGSAFRHRGKHGGGIEITGEKDCLAGYGGVEGNACRP
jgi:hypothetical protein